VCRRVPHAHQIRLVSQLGPVEKPVREARYEGVDAVGQSATGQEVPVGSEGARARGRRGGESGVGVVGVVRVIRVIRAAEIRYSAGEAQEDLPHTHTHTHTHTHKHGRAADRQTGRHAIIAPCDRRHDRHSHSPTTWPICIPCPNRLYSGEK
jgi:hypothetical protein